MTPSHDKRPAPDQDIAPGCVTMYGAAKLSGIPIRTLRNACQTGRLPARHVPAPWTPCGVAWAIDRAALADYAQRYRQRRMSWEIAQQMRRRYYEDGQRQRDIATEFRVSRGIVSDVMCRHIWTSPTGPRTAERRKRGRGDRERSAA